MQLGHRHQKIGYKVFKVASFNSLLVTTLVILIFLISSYFDFSKKFQTSIITIENSFLSSIGNAGWNYDESQLEQIISGIVKLPYVSSLDISIPPYFAQKHESQTTDLVENHSFEIIYDDQVIGNLQVYMNKGLLYSELFNIGFKGVLISFFISILIGVLTYFVIKKMISRRIVEIANQLNHIDIDKKDFKFFLSELEKSPLELVSIVDALNAMFRDINIEREKNFQYQEKLEKAANYDPLTKLPNRHHAEKKVASLIARDSQNAFAAVFINFGSFKSINESYGRSVGDRFLIETAERLKRLYPKNYCARLGKDQFVLLFPDEEGFILNQSLRCLTQHLSEPVELKNISSHFELKLFLGISLYPKTSGDVEEIFTHGEIALRMSKKENFPVIYDNDLSEISKLHNQIRLFLPKAIRDQAFHLNYQPIINLETNDIYSMECLIRWTDNDLGVIRPDIFIEIAEEDGLIHQIDEFLFSQAMIEFKQIQKVIGSHLVLSVNVSYLHFKEAGFVQFIENQLTRNHFNPRCLKIEITERVFLGDQNLVREKMQQLIDMGVSIAIDDFGTGYSSINSVKSFPFDTLKMDKSLVDMISSSERDLLLVRNVIRMAHDLGMSVVAEGVETSEQYNILKQSNCKFCQGYFFEKPQVADYFILNLKNS